MNNAVERNDLFWNEHTGNNTSTGELHRERNWLVQELNHRVRNILQVVHSLLNTQLHYLQDESAIEATRENQRRIFALSLTYTQLNPKGIVNKVPMRWYIGELVQYLADSYGVRNEIRFEQQVEEIELDLSQALSVGLIVHEAVSNSIKYAFPIPGRGLIRIALLHTGDHSTSLCVSDNGVGIPSPFFAEGTGQLGLRLIRGLAVDLDASFHLRNDEGAVVNIEFRASE